MIIVLAIRLVFSLIIFVFLLYLAYKVLVSKVGWIRKFERRSRLNDLDETSESVSILEEEVHTSRNLALKINDLDTKKQIFEADKKRISNFKKENK